MAFERIDPPEGMPDTSPNSFHLPGTRDGTHWTTKPSDAYHRESATTKPRLVNLVDAEAAGYPPGNTLEQNQAIWRGLYERWSAHRNPRYFNLTEGWQFAYGLRKEWHLSMRRPSAPWLEE